MKWLWLNYYKWINKETQTQLRCMVTLLNQHAHTHKERLLLRSLKVHTHLTFPLFVHIQFHCMEKSTLDNLLNVSFCISWIETKSYSFQTTWWLNIYSAVPWTFHLLTQGVLCYVAWYRQISIYEFNPRIKLPDDVLYRSTPGWHKSISAICIVGRKPVHSPAKSGVRYWCITE